ncbi:MAG: hypothetical protein IKG52_04145 [Rhodobacteraceae bacterium]|nr:hypothetical protein [Paracoccaceae bacterium]
MTLRKRLGRLEGKRGTAAPGPSLVFLCEAETREPLAAMLMGGGSLTREDGETVEAFTAQAEAGADWAVFFPDNGRDGLATDKSPRWASGALVEKALRARHAPE